MALGLCSQTDLDTEVQKGAARLERERGEQRKKLEKTGTLLPTSETVPGLGPQPDIDLGAVFAEPVTRPARTEDDSESATDEPEQGVEAEPRDEVKTDQT